LIGNYGVNAEDEESFRPFVRGVIVRELSRRPSNFRSENDLGTYLKKYGIVGISGVDTRAVTKLLRVSGSLKGVLGAGDPGDRNLADDVLVDKAKSWPGLGGIDMVAEVSTKTPHRWTKGFGSSFSACFRANLPEQHVGEGFRIAAFDYGIKHNILRIFHDLGFEVHVLPAKATADAARATQAP